MLSSADDSLRDDFRPLNGRSVMRLKTFGYQSERQDRMKLNRTNRMQFWDFVDGPLLKLSKVLEEDGLPLLFSDENVTIPWDIQSDSKALFQKWVNGSLDPDLLRYVL